MLMLDRPRLRCNLTHMRANRLDVEYTAAFLVIKQLVPARVAKLTLLSVCLDFLLVLIVKKAGANIIILHAMATQTIDMVVKIFYGRYDLPLRVLN